MRLNGATLNPNDLKFYDVCVVGSGVVGFTLARMFNACGLVSVHLESGIENVKAQSKNGERWYDPVVLDLDNGGLNPDLQKLRSDFLTQARTRCYGGSSNCWGGWIRPMDDYDFLIYPGWPVIKEELDPYYRNALKDMMKLDHYDLFDKPEEWVTQALTEVKIATLNKDTLKKAGLKQVVIQQQTEDKIRDFQEQLDDLFGPPDQPERGERTTLIVNATALQLEYAKKEDNLWTMTGIKCGSLKSETEKAQTFTGACPGSS